VKMRRKTASSALNRPAVVGYIPFIDLETRDFARGLLAKGQYGQVAFHIKPSIQRFILNLSLTLNYGWRLGQQDQVLFDEITYIEEQISRFRSTTGNLQDYIPFLRLNPINVKSALAKNINARRLVYFSRLNRELNERIANGTDQPCIQGDVIKDPDAKLNDLELLSISMTMLGNRTNLNWRHR
jgi:3-hydroxyphenylacetate 6-hydroxylase